MITLFISYAINSVFALPIKVTDELFHPISQVMVNVVPLNPKKLDSSDNGYPKPNTGFPSEPSHTFFTNEQGIVEIGTYSQKLKIRIRKPGYQDLTLDFEADSKNALFMMKQEKDPVKLAESKPANVWLGALELKSREDKIHFQMQCGFCHQQGTQFTRLERSAEDWSSVIKRMVRYGARLPSRLQKSLPEDLQIGFRKLRENPKLLSEGTPWSKNLPGVRITEWPIGDSMSQTHDMLVGTNKKVYVADNIQDRLYETDPKTNTITVFKIPHLPSDSPGGLISGRLKDFPKHDSTSNAHSLAQSLVDGHIFITPSAQRRIIEFNPADQSFKIHEIGTGFYPHTIRIDQKDRVWFTLALSNQVGMLNRDDGKFTIYDLPARNLREKIVTKFIGGIFKLISWGIPLTTMLSIDDISTGTPLPYGIDVTPDGKVWVARLHSKEIGMIDPDNGSVTMINTPFAGPRRLRSDMNGNLWIVSFGESAISKYDPKTFQFKVYNLPVIPKGSETPYSLAVNHKTNQVWVTGNQSNAVYIFDIRAETWDSIPLPKRTTFTRDFDFDEEGNAYTSNSNFPSWQIEDAQPTLIRLEKR